MGKIWELHQANNLDYRPFRGYRSKEENRDINLQREVHYQFKYQNNNNFSVKNNFEALRDDSFQPYFETYPEAIIDFDGKLKTVCNILDNKIKEIGGKRTRNAHSGGTYRSLFEDAIR